MNKQSFSTNNPLVSILILTYDRTDLLKSCLESVLKIKYSNLEFIVSDNGSVENISMFVRKNFPRKKIKVVRLVENRGLTGGFNYGFKFCKGKYTMVLSNDTKIDENAVSFMVDMAEKDPSIGIISPQIIQMRNPKLLHNAGSFLTYTGFLYHYGILKSKSSSYYQKNYYIFSCNGAGFLIRREAAKKSGLFEEDFFYFYDDSDLSHRIWLSGHTVVYCAEAKLLHLWSATMQGTNNRIWYYNHRHHISSFIVNLSLPYLLLILVNFNLMLLFWFVMNICKLKFDVAITLPKAYLWHIINIKKTLERRNFIQNEIRQVSDSEIFKKCLVSPNLEYYLMYLHFKNKDYKLPNRVMY